MPHHIHVVSDRQDPAAVDRVLRSLPDWFGIEQAIVDYVESAQAMPTYLAVLEDHVVGIMLIARHFPGSAEIHLIAVEPGRHRTGIGRELVQRAETDLAADGVEFLQVKTIGPSHPSPHYAKTRLFYAACGFKPLEEMIDVWPDNPFLIQVKALPSPMPA